MTKGTPDWRAFLFSLAERGSAAYVISCTKLMLIFFIAEENEPKEGARVPLNPARRRHGRSARKLASLRQSARFYPAVSLMLGAGQREIQKPNLKNCF